MRPSHKLLLFSSHEYELLERTYYTHWQGLKKKFHARLIDFSHYAVARSLRRRAPGALDSKRWKQLSHSVKTD